MNEIKLNDIDFHKEIIFCENQTYNKRDIKKICGYFTYQINSKPHFENKLYDDVINIDAYSNFHQMMHIMSEFLDVDFRTEGSINKGLKDLFEKRCNEDLIYSIISFLKYHLMYKLITKQDAIHTIREISAESTYLKIKEIITQSKVFLNNSIYNKYIIDRYFSDYDVIDSKINDDELFCLIDDELYKVLLPQEDVILFRHRSFSSTILDTVLDRLVSEIKNTDLGPKHEYFEINTVKDVKRYLHDFYVFDQNKNFKIYYDIIYLIKSFRKDVSQICDKLLYFTASIYVVYDKIMHDERLNNFFLQQLIDLKHVENYNNISVLDLRFLEAKLNIPYRSFIEPFFNRDGFRAGSIGDSVDEFFAVLDGRKDFSEIDFTQLSFNDKLTILIKLIYMLTRTTINNDRYKNNTYIEKFIKISEDVLDWIFNYPNIAWHKVHRITSLISLKNNLKIRYNYDNNLWDKKELVDTYYKEIKYLIDNNLVYRFGNIDNLGRLIEEIGKVADAYSGIHEFVNLIDIIFTELNKFIVSMPIYDAKTYFLNFNIDEEVVQKFRCGFKTTNLKDVDWTRENVDLIIYYMQIISSFSSIIKTYGLGEITSDRGNNSLNIMVRELIERFWSVFVDYRTMDTDVYFTTNSVKGKFIY